MECICVYVIGVVLCTACRRSSCHRHQGMYMCWCSRCPYTYTHCTSRHTYIYTMLTYIHVNIHYIRISQDAYRGQVPLGLLVLNEPTPEHPTIDSSAVIQHAIDAVRSKIGAFAVFKKAVIVEKLPKTRSGMCIVGSLL